MTRRLAVIIALGGSAGAGLGSACDRGDECGPTSAVVARVVDGDTVELDSGERVRYLLVDTPESTGGQSECFGTESADFNRQLVEGKEVELSYDAECQDRFGRLLAFVSVNGREVNSLLVERGMACVLIIPPNGEGRGQEFETLEARAEAGMVGLWGACEDIPCG